LEYGIDRGHARARRRQGDLERIGTNDRVGVGEAAAVGRELLDALDLLGRVNLGNRFLRQRLIGPGRTLLVQAGFLQARGYRTKAVGGFGVPAGVVFEEQRVGIEEGHEAVRSQERGSHGAECGSILSPAGGLATDSTGWGVVPLAAGRSAASGS